MPLSRIPDFWISGTGCFSLIRVHRASMPRALLAARGQVIQLPRQMHGDHDHCAVLHFVVAGDVGWSRRRQHRCLRLCSALAWQWQWQAACECLCVWPCYWKTFASLRVRILSGAALASAIMMMTERPHFDGRGIARWHPGVNIGLQIYHSACNEPRLVFLATFSLYLA